MKPIDRSDCWMILAVLVCLAGSVPRGIGQPAPPLTAGTNGCWFGDVRETVECVVSRALGGVETGLRLLPLIERGAQRW